MSFLRNLKNKIKAGFIARWSSYTPYQKRVLLLYSPLFGFSTLVVLELAVWWYGGDPSAPFLSLPPFLVWTINRFHYIPLLTGVHLPPYLTFRQFVYLLRFLLLLPWSFYLTYLFLIRPSFFKLVKDYRELRDSSFSLPLSFLRLFTTSSELPKLFFYPFSIIYIFLVAFLGLLSTFSFFLLLYLCFLSLCYLEFKAGRYPGIEPEFWKELSSFSNLLLLRVGSIAFLVGLGYAVYQFSLLIGLGYRIDLLEKQQEYYSNLSDTLSKNYDELSNSLKQHYEEQFTQLQSEREAFEQEKRRSKKGGWF